MNYEHFNCAVLPEQDILIIVMKIIGTFITSSLERKVYINLDLPDGTDKGCLDNERNIDIVDVPFSEFDIQYLGTDDNDNIIEPQITQTTRTKYYPRSP